MRRVAVIVVLLGAAGLLGWLFPPFRLVPLGQARAAEAGNQFDAAAYAATFWRDNLVPGLARAADAAAVLEGLKRDPADTARRHGRTLGLSDAVLYCLTGTGTIVAIEDRGLAVSLQGPGGPPDLLLRTGLLFGNTVRDATGLIDVNLFADSQHFNAVSGELNRIVETEVLPPLKAGAAVGRRIRFVAAVEVQPGAEGDRPLVVIPLQGKVE